MVSTRHHPRAFPEPTSPSTRSKTTTPSKASSSARSSPASPTSPSVPTSDVVSNAASKPSAVRAAPRKRKSTGPATLSSYTHIVNPITIAWLLFSVPLVIWDTAYVFLRPMSMPGGSLHRPIWSLYAIYAAVDYNYGWPAWNDGVGFTAAQASLNAIETSMYIYYLTILFLRGKKEGVLQLWKKEFWTEKNLVGGEGMACAVLVCYAASVMTLSKTVLYWLNEYFSKFENIGHNTWSALFWYWILPNGLWMIFPAYIIYELGQEVIGAMHLAGSSGREKAD